MASRFTLTQLEYLIAVADEGSITAAAAKAHATAGAVSMSLKELEQRLGIQLFIRRRSKAATLTPAGHNAVADARRVLSAADELQYSAGSSQKDISGTLRVGCYTTLAPFLIPPLLDEFATAHPDLTVQILEGPADLVPNAIADGRCEAGFLYEDDLPKGFQSRVVRENKPYVILASNHPLADRVAVRLADLADEPLIMFDVPSARSAARFVESAGLSAQIRHFSSNIELVRSLVARGIGYSILIQRWPIDLSYEGRPIAAVPIEDPIAAHRTVLAWSSGIRLTRRTQALIEFSEHAFH